jgi:two-component system sensor histidine kinase/response regulator
MVKRRSLILKLTVFVSVIIFMSTALLGMVLAVNYSRNEEQRLVNSLTKELQIVSFALSAGMEFNDTKTEEADLSLLKNIREFESIRILDRDGKLIMERKFHKSPSDAAKRFELHVPVMNESNQLIGRIRATATGEYLKNDIFNGLVMVCLIMLLMMILTILLISFILRRFLRPLLLLKTSMDNWSVSSSLEQMTVIPDDEVGDLAVSFNAMSTRLRDTTVSRDDLINEIEERKKLEFDLMQAKIKAETANRAKSEFMAKMSHEIRTPLNSILGFGELFNTTQMTDQQRNFLDMLNSNSRLLLAIINEILDFSKIEAGGIQLESIEFDLHYLVIDILKIFKARGEKRGVFYYVDINPTVPVRIKGDPTRLRQILTNLLDNADKFTPKGQIGLTLELDPNKQASGDEVYLCIMVRDTGIGIAADKMDSIFQPFTQADNSITRKYGGTGLGLTIIKSLVEIMGGTITLESKEGVGTVFTVCVKFSKAVTVIYDQINKLKREELRGKKVLILDDNEIILKIVNKACESVGMEVLSSEKTAESIQVSLEKLIREGNVPDLLLFDIMLQKSDSLGLVRTIRQDDRLKHCKIVAITAQTRIGDIKTAKEAGFDGYLSQPFNIGDFVQVIAMVLGCQGQETMVVTRHVAEEMSCKGIEILVVDDSMSNIALMEEYLKVLGCKADFAYDGQEAVEKLRGEKKYDLCLMDIQMPKISGMGATAIIRKEIDANIPIIALSAAVLKEEREAALKAGMNDFLEKPLKLSALRDTLKKYGYRGMLKQKSEELQLPLEVYLRLAQKALDESRDALPELEKAMDAGDFAVIQTITHKLKGTCGTVHLNMIAMPAGQINDLAKKNDGLARMRELFPLLRDAIEKTRI